MNELRLTLNQDTRTELQALADAHGMPAASIASAFITDGIQGHGARHSGFDGKPTIQGMGEEDGAIWGE